MKDKIRQVLREQKERWDEPQMRKMLKGTCVYMKNILKDNPSILKVLCVIYPNKDLVIQVHYKLKDYNEVTDHVAPFRKSLMEYFGFNRVSIEMEHSKNHFDALVNWYQTQSDGMTEVIDFSPENLNEQNSPTKEEKYLKKIKRVCDMVQQEYPGMQKIVVQTYTDRWSDDVVADLFILCGKDEKDRHDIFDVLQNRIYEYLNVETSITTYTSPMRIEMDERYVQTFSKKFNLPNAFMTIDYTTPENLMEGKLPPEKAMKLLPKILDNYQKQLPTIQKVFIQAIDEGRMDGITYYINIYTTEQFEWNIIAEMQESIYVYIGVRNIGIRQTDEDEVFEIRVERDKTKYGGDYIYRDYTQQNLQEEETGKSKLKMVKAVALIFDQLQKTYPDIQKVLVGADRFDDRIFVNILCSGNENYNQRMARKQAQLDALNDYLSLGREAVFIWDYTDDKIFTMHTTRDMKDIATEYVFRDYTEQNLQEQGEPKHGKMFKAVFVATKNYLQNIEAVKRFMVGEWKGQYAVMVQYEPKKSEFHPDFLKDTLYEYLNQNVDVMGVTHDAAFNCYLYEIYDRWNPEVENLSPEKLSEQNDTQKEKMMKGIARYIKEQLKNYPSIKKFSLTQYDARKYGIEVLWNGTDYDHDPTYNKTVNVIRDICQNIIDLFSVQSVQPYVLHQTHFDETIKSREEKNRTFMVVDLQADSLMEEKSGEDKMLKAMVNIADTFLKQFDDVIQFGVVIRPKSTHLVLIEYDAPKLSMGMRFMQLEDKVQDYLDIKCIVLPTRSDSKFQKDMERYTRDGYQTHVVDFTKDQEMLSENTEEKMLKAVVHVVEDFLKPLDFVTRVAIADYGDKQYAALVEYEPDYSYDAEPRNMIIDNLRNRVKDYLGLYFTVYSITVGKTFDNQMQHWKVKNIPAHVIFDQTQDLLSENTENKMVKAIEKITTNYVSEFEFVNKYVILDDTIDYIILLELNFDAFQDYGVRLHDLCCNLEERLSDYLGIKIGVRPMRSHEQTMGHIEYFESRGYPHAHIIDCSGNRRIVSEQKSRDGKMVNIFKKIINQFLEGHDFVTRYAILSNKEIYKVLLEVNTDKVGDSDVHLHTFCYDLKNTINDYLGINCGVVVMGGPRMTQREIDFWCHDGRTAHIIDCSTNQ